MTEIAQTRANRITSGITNTTAKIIITAGVTPDSPITQTRVETGTKVATEMGTAKERKEIKTSNLKATIMKLKRQLAPSHTHPHLHLV